MDTIAPQYSFGRSSTYGELRSAGGIADAALSTHSVDRVLTAKRPLNVAVAQPPLSTHSVDRVLTDDVALSPKWMSVDALSTHSVDRVLTEV